MENNELTEYLNHGVENLIANTLKHTFSNPKETAFLLSQIKYQSENAVARKKYEIDGIHIPVFLIASITTECNLHCVGCYARANGICFDEGKHLPLAHENKTPMLSKEQWNKIFSEAEQLGIGFILLAGGEPVLREDIIECAAAHKKIIFPVFTNGTIVSEKILKLFDEHRNLVPVISVEGTENETNSRRGLGTYEKIETAVSVFEKNKILYGVSLTVTKENYLEVVSDEFLKHLAEKSVRIVFLIEYTAVDRKTKNLELSETEREELDRILQEAKQKFGSMLFLSFPGDEKYMGGCIAGGRGFFHINPYGEAEACPFSPYSDRNVAKSSIIDALASPLFSRLRKEGLVGGEHDGGCALFEHEDKVKEIFKEKGFRLS